MAFNIPRNPTLLESLGLGLQGALPGLVAGAQQRTQQGALGQIGQQLGLTIPPGTPPQVAQALFAAALQRQGQSQQPFTLPAGAQRFGPGGELIAESPFAPQRPLAPRAPTAFESTQTQIDSLSAIPEDQRTPTQQARLDQLLDRKELTRTQEQAKEIRRLQAIPENRRTSAQKESLKKLLEGTAGVQITFGKPASAAERTAIAETQASISTLDNLEKLFNNAQTRTGPIVGRIDPIKGLLGLTSAEQEDFMAATAAFENKVIKDITGAQMSEVEAIRILRQVPRITDPPVRWRAKLKQTRRNLIEIQKRRSEVLKKSGIVSPLDGETINIRTSESRGASDEDILRILGGQ